MIRDGDAERATASGFADNSGDYRDAQARHFPQVVSDRFSHVALLRINARIGTRSIDKCQNRAIELLGQPHHAERLAIAFRLCIPEITLLPCFEVTAFLLANDHDRLIMKCSEPANHRRIVCDSAIPVKFGELAEEERRIIKQVWPIWMT